MRLGAVTLALLAGAAATPAVAQVEVETGRVHVLERVPDSEVPLRGPRFAAVTIEEFACFPCPASAEIQAAVHQTLRRHGDGVRLLFRHLPQARFAGAQLAAQAAVEAGAQGRFWAYHDALFARGGRLHRDDLLRIAARVGLDVARLRRALDDGRHRAAVAADERVAQARGIREAPALVVNGKVLAGSTLTFDLEQAVADGAERARERLASGDPLHRLFEALVGDAGPALTTRREVVPPGSAPVLGPAGARVTVVLFADLADVKQTRSPAELDRLRGEYPGDVRVAFRHGPGGPPLSDTLAQAAAEAFAQGRFWEFATRLAAPPRDVPAIEREAREAGMDLDALRAALSDGRHRASVQADRAEALRLGIDRSALFINGRRAATTAGHDEIRAMIEEERRGGFLGRL